MVLHRVTKKLICARFGPVQSDLPTAAVINKLLKSTVRRFNSIDASFQIAFCGFFRAVFNYVQLVWLAIG